MADNVEKKVDFESEFSDIESLIDDTAIED